MAVPRRENCAWIIILTSPLFLYKRHLSLNSRHNRCMLLLVFSFRKSCLSLLCHLSRQKAGEPTCSCSTESWKNWAGSWLQHQDAGNVLTLRYKLLRGLCCHLQLCRFHTLLPLKTWPEQFLVVCFQSKKGCREKSSLAQLWGSSACSQKKGSNVLPVLSLKLTIST